MFEQWLHTTKITDDFAGDFITDARGESARFRHVASLRDLQRALPVMACEECRDALPEVWRRYKAWKDARP